MHAFKVSEILPKNAKRKLSILCLFKVHITPLMKFRPENPFGVKRSHTKISRIRLGISLQLSFSSFEKIQNYDVTSGIIIRLSMEETMIS